jgi:hypothetical protein
MNVKLTTGEDKVALINSLHTFFISIDDMKTL